MNDLVTEAWLLLEYSECSFNGMIGAVGGILHRIPHDYKCREQV